MASSGEREETQEDSNEKESGAEETEVVLDLSGRRLKRLERAPVNQTFATALVLDNNNLQNLANLDSYGELERLSIANNQIVRMYWFARMYSIRILNIPNNNIVQIEGLRELHHLIHLNVSGNNLKNIEGLSYSHKLEHLNLSGNFLSQISDLSMLKNVKELFLHRNRICTLHRCNKYLPPSLYILTLSDNSISDLNDLCNLSHLTSLEQFTILNNPCLDPLHQVDETGEPTGPLLEFDNRPYVINWCLNLKVLDGYKVTPKESLKAEWLYSQGKGRHFQVGEHEALVQYLSGVCLAGGGWGGADLPDDDDKLGKILQLAKQHQQDLRHSAVNGHDNSDSSSGRGSRGSSHHDSPASLRRSVATAAVAAARTAPVRRNPVPTRQAKTGHDGHRRSNTHTAVCAPVVPSAVKHQQEATSHSYHVELSSTLYGGDLKTPDTPSLMTQSMDPAILAQLSAPEAPPAHPSQIVHPMSQSYDPEQMARSLETDHILSCSAAGLDEHRPVIRHHDLMSQSLGPEQLKMTLSSYSNQDDRWDRLERSCEYPSRPTRLFAEDSDSLTEEPRDHEEMSHLEGSSQFVPAPESIMSPEFQSGISQSDHSSSALPRSSSMTKSPYVCRSSKPPVSSRTVTSQSASKAVPRSSSNQRPKTAPVKSPAPDSSRGSPRAQHRSHTSVTSSPNMSPRSRQSPKPAPRSVRTNINNTASTQLNCVSNKVMKSPTTPQGVSEGESENTDSEMSVSKLQTIKSIAAERKGKERRSTSGSVRSVEEAPFRQERGTHGGSSQTYNPDKYRGSPHLRSQSRGRKSSNGSGGSIDSRGSNRGHSESRGETSVMKIHAAITLQRYWRGYSTRHKNPDVFHFREDIRQSRAEQHIRHLTEKLKAAEAALERERKLRHLQLDAIRTLWREIQKLQAGRTKDGVNTPSTPMTPLTPLTPLEGAKKVASGSRTKVYSEESVKELTEFCSSLQSQVSDLQKSLSMVTQVMNAFCHLPGSQSLLTMSQSSGSGMERSIGEDDPLLQCLSHGQGGPSVPLSESVTSFTNSILALTSSIKYDGAQVKNLKTEEGAVRISDAKCSAKPENSVPSYGPDMAASVTSLTSNDLNSTGQDVSTLSNDSNEEGDIAHQQEADLSDSSDSSHSGGNSGSHQNHEGSRQRSMGPPRPSSLPVARPHTPRANS